MANKTLLDRIGQGRQYRSMTMNVIETQKEENEEKKYIVEGYASTFNEPYTLIKTDDVEVREQISPNAFDECDMSDVIFQYDHCGRVYARGSNNTLGIISDSHGLKIRADLSGTEEGRKLHEEIKGGYTTKMSFGFTVGDDEIKYFTEGEKRIALRTIKKITNLYDVSAVSLPANDGTEISARNFCDGVIKEIEKRIADDEEAEKQQKEAEAEKKELELAKAKLELVSMF